MIRVAGYKNKKCSMCKYRSNEPSLNDCDYAAITGGTLTKRNIGCPTADECREFKKGARISKREELPGPVPSRDTQGDEEWQRYDYRKHQRFFGYKEGLHQYYESKK